MMKSYIKMVGWSLPESAVTLFSDRIGANTHLPIIAFIPKHPGAI